MTADGLLVTILSGICSYSLCSIPFNWLNARIYGVNLLKFESGNIGGTNAVRALGLKAAPGFLLDIVKGTLAVVIVRFVVFPQWGIETTPALLLSILLACVLGHMYSPLLGFKGGKGIAVAGGGLFAIDPLFGLTFAVIWLTMVLLSDMVSVGSVVSALAFPAYVWYFYGHDWHATAVALVITFMIVSAHRGNIGRIMSGTERRLHWPFYRLVTLSLVKPVWLFIIWPPIRWLGESIFRPLFFGGGVVLIRAILLSGAIDIRGAENIPVEGKPYLLVANHLRDSDPFFLGSLTGRRVIFMAKKEIWEKSSLLAFLMWVCEAIRTDREDKRSVLRASLSAIEALKRGRTIGIFPEGTRNKTPHHGLAPLHSIGALAERAGCDALPVGIAYHGKFWPSIWVGEMIINPNNQVDVPPEVIVERYGAKNVVGAIDAMVKEALEALWHQ